MRTLNLSLFLFILLLWLSPLSGQTNESISWMEERPAPWAYDPGPSVETQKDLIDLHAAIPNFPGISLEIMRHRFSKPMQKFRPAYGPIPWRMILRPNHVKILFIGQDGTHIAEAANRPGTAGFGGRAHSLASFFGVEYSAAFINTYAFTIKGQYGARGAPYVYKGKVNTRQTIIPNDVWLMSQDSDSPISQWRNDLIEWIINNNRQSLKLIVLFGGSAKDSIAGFIESRGGKVSSHFERKMANIQVPEFFMMPSGGNGEFPVPFDQHGGDAYQNLLGRRLNYTKESETSQVRSYLQNHHDKAIATMVFSKAGPYGNGLLHHAQLGGYDLNKIWVKREHARNRLPTRSLKGLNLKKGGPVGNHIFVLSLPHPTFLSHAKNNTAIRHWESELEKELEKEGNFSSTRKKISSALPHKKLDTILKILDDFPDTNIAHRIRANGYNYGNKKVADLVEKDVAKIRPYLQQGGHIPADPSAPHSKRPNENQFAQGKKYKYGRSKIHKVYYDFGTPEKPHGLFLYSSPRKTQNEKKKKKQRIADYHFWFSRHSCLRL